MRYLPLLALCWLFACRPAPQASLPASPPTGKVLTIIMKAFPERDTLEVVDIIQGPGRLRTDYPSALKEVPNDHLVFTFTDEEGNTLRQTSLPYPGPAQYEVPSEGGTLERVTVSEADRVIDLRTQLNRRLRWLQIEGINPVGKAIRQQIDLKR